MCWLWFLHVNRRKLLAPADNTSEASIVGVVAELLKLYRWLSLFTTNQHDQNKLLLCEVNGMSSKFPFDLGNLNLY